MGYKGKIGLPWYNQQVLIDPLVNWYETKCRVEIYLHDTRDATY